MSSFQQPAQGSPGEYLFFPVVTAMLLIGLWIGLRVPIMWISFYCSYWMFSVYEHLPWLMTDVQYETLRGAKAAIPGINPTKHGLKSFWMLATIHGYVLRWLVVPLMIYWGWRTKRSVVRFKYRRHIRNVYDLIDIQAKHFPASAIIKGKNLLAKHPYEGPWATYALPLDFALDHKLLWASQERISPNQKVDEERMFPVPPFTLDQKVMNFSQKRELMPHYRYVTLNVERANAVFSAQLGQLWPGHDALPPLIKALYAVFCTQAAGHQGEAWKMVEQLAFSFREGKYDAKGKLITPHYANTKGTDELLAKYADHPKVVKVRSLHAHTINIMFGTLGACRKAGRLTHANFLWLKPVNRTLWYALCGQGGQIPYWEAAGPWAHMLVEERIGRPLVKPMVAAAVYTMYDFMAREHWIDPGVYSEENQRRMVEEANEMLNQEREMAKNKGKRGSAMPAGAFGAPVKARQKQLLEDEEP